MGVDELSRMVPQQKFQWVRVQINLLFEVWLMEFPNIMIQEDDRNDQRDILLPVAIDGFQQFLFFIGGELFS